MDQEGAERMISVRNLTKRFGEFTAVDRVSFQVPRGTIFGFVGSNGSGKSTLLRIMAGAETEFAGTARPDPTARIGFLPQEPQLDESLDVLGNVELALKPVRDLFSMNRRMISMSRPCVLWKKA